MSVQPSGMNSSNGVILSVGMFCNEESFQIVMPCVTPATSSLDDGNRCGDAVKSFVNELAPELCAIISSSCYISFASAVGMTQGNIPFRQGFAPTELVGTRHADSLPTQDCALGVIYQDPADIGFDRGKIRMARTFFSAIAKQDSVANKLVADVQTAMATLLDHMVTGWTSFTASGVNWYRVLDVPKPTSSGQAVKRLFEPLTRENIYTQKRRMTPRNS